MGQVSVPSVSVDLAKQIFGDLKGRTVMLIGSGEMAETVARLLARRWRAHRDRRPQPAQGGRAHAQRWWRGPAVGRPEGDPGRSRRGHHQYQRADLRRRLRSGEERPQAAPRTQPVLHRPGGSARCRPARRVARQHLPLQRRRLLEGRCRHAVQPPARGGAGRADCPGRGRGLPALARSGADDADHRGAARAFPPRAGRGAGPQSQGEAETPGSRTSARPWPRCARLR